MKASRVVPFALAAAIAVTAAIGADAPDRPAGVEAKSWIQVSDTLGFVVTPPVAVPQGSNSRQVLLLMPPAEGYFMAKTAAGWRRLVIVEPAKGPSVSG
jgi:hypothetical protein